MLHNGECELQEQNKASKGNDLLLHHGESGQDIGGRGNGAASAASGGPLIEEEQQQPVVLVMEGGEAGIAPPPPGRVKQSRAHRAVGRTI